MSTAGPEVLASVRGSPQLHPLWGSRAPRLRDRRIIVRRRIRPCIKAARQAPLNTHPVQSQSIPSNHPHLILALAFTFELSTITSKMYSLFTVIALAAYSAALPAMEPRQ